MQLVYKSSLLLVFLLISFTLVQSQEIYKGQNKRDTKLLSQVLSDIIEINSHNIDKKLYLIQDEPLSFSQLDDNQDVFFSLKYFQRYLQPVLGINKNKIKEIINSIDFNYCDLQKSNSLRWKKNNFTSTIKIVKKNCKIKNRYELVHQISRPIYSKKMNYAFILYASKCKIIDACSGANVKVFKRGKKTWEYYTTIPVSLN